MTRLTTAKVTFLALLDPTKEQREDIASATGFPVTDKQLQFMATSGYIFRTTATNIAFQVKPRALGLLITP